MVQIDPQECIPLRPLVVSKAEAARLLSVSVRTIYYMLDDGRLRGVSIGRHRKVLMDSIDEFLAGAVA